jgi:hypothetical protein
MLEYLDYVNLANPPTEHQCFAQKLTHKNQTKMVHFLTLAKNRGNMTDSREGYRGNWQYLAFK